MNVSKEYRWERTVVSIVLSHTPVTLGAVIVTPHESKNGTVKLYDGESSVDPLVITITSGVGMTKVININPNMIMNRGLYIELGGDVDEALVFYSRQ